MASSRRDVKTVCSRCFTRSSCVSCCGSAFCLRHFHTSDHASEHPHKAVISNAMVLEQQTPEFSKMWTDCFEDVQEEVEAHLREYDRRTEKDPLGALLMAPAAGGGSGNASTSSSKRGGVKRPRSSVSLTREGGEGGGGGSIGGDQGARQRGKQEPRLPASADLTKKRSSKRRIYWNVGQQQQQQGDGGGAGAGAGAGSTSGASSSGAVVPGYTPLQVYKGVYRCRACKSLDTNGRPFGGAGRDIGKAETWGSKERPELILAMCCNACGSTWREEE